MFTTNSLWVSETSVKMNSTEREIKSNIMDPAFIECQEAPVFLKC